MIFFSESPRIHLPSALLLSSLFLEYSFVVVPKKEASHLYIWNSTFFCISKSRTWIKQHRWDVGLWGGELCNTSTDRLWGCGGCLWPPFWWAWPIGGTYCRSEGRRGVWLGNCVSTSSLPVGSLGGGSTVQSLRSCHTALSTLDWSCWAPLIMSLSHSFMPKIGMHPHCSPGTPL